MMRLYFRFHLITSLYVDGFYLITSLYVDRYRHKALAPLVVVRGGWLSVRYQRKLATLGEETLHRDTTAQLVTSPECRDARADLHSLRAPDLSSSGSEATLSIPIMAAKPVQMPRSCSRPDTWF